MKLIDLSVYLFEIINLFCLLVYIFDIIFFSLYLKEKRRKRNLYFSLIKMIVSIIILTLLLSSYSMKMDNHYNDTFINWVSSINVFVVLMILFISFVLSLFELVFFFRGKGAYISLKSIKESIDELPTGLCFYETSGLVLLKNTLIEKICVEMTGSSLLNGEEFWDLIMSDKFSQIRLSSNEKPIIKLNNNLIFCFNKINHDGIYEIVASNISSEYSLSEELRKKNIELKDMNYRLKKYSENIYDYTREKEVLAVKIHIHDEIGKILIQSLISLQGINGRKKLLDDWKKVVMFFGIIENKNSDDQISDLLRVANDIGVKVIYKGAKPRKGTIEGKILENAIHETITNTIIHGKCEELYIEVTDYKTHYEAFFNNNGIKPKTDIIEGGGLSSLRTLVERDGGKMSIEISPSFRISIKIPKSEE